MTTFAIPSPNSTVGKAKHSRRWIPVSVRIFAAVLVLLGLGSALWIAVPAYLQHRAIREIELLGGVVQTQPNGPKWLHDLIGNDWMRPFDALVTVKLSDTKATDGTLRQLRGMTRLSTLDLAGTHVTDAGLSNLNGLDSLLTLYLSNTKLTGKGLAHVKGLPKLAYIFIVDTPLTDAGLAQLEALHSLTWLHLDKTEVTDAGLEHLKGLKKLNWITLETRE